MQRGRLPCRAAPHTSPPTLHSALPGHPAPVPPGTPLVLCAVGVRAQREANLPLKWLHTQLCKRPLHRAGDSACVIPPQTVSKEIQDTIRTWVKSIAKDLNVVGLINVQVSGCASLLARVRGA